MQTHFRLLVKFVVASGILIGATTVFAQSTADEIAKYRQMIADGNPSELYEDAGAELWKKPAGPKNATLEKCNLGLGPGVIKGASAQLPRYFADTNKVQDLESRLITCMSTLQGISAQEIIEAPFQKGLKKDMDALVAYVVTASKDQKIKVSTKHPKEKEA
jgi:sulfur-oxidizing protein SoxA